MSVQFSAVPDKITARESAAQKEWRPVTVAIDTADFVFLTIEQARSLWHELGAVLQSIDHNEMFGHPLDECAGTPDA